MIAAHVRELVKPGEHPDLYGWAACIECEHVTPRRLAPHIPHLCTDCLFPRAPIGGTAYGAVAELDRLSGRRWEKASV